MIIQNTFYKLISLFIFTTVLFACSDGGSGESAGVIATRTGVFLDSAVEGVSYQTSSGIVGYTNANGEYQYKDGDTVEFLIGDISLGNIDAKDLISVLELTNSAEVAMLLQALDADANPENGINITTQAFQLFENSSININTVDPDNTEFLSTFKELSGYDFEVDKVNALEHASYSLMLENLKAVSINLYDYYVGNINIYENNSMINTALLQTKSTKRLLLYNYTNVSKIELSIMQMNAKSQIDGNFDSLELRRKAISDASTIMSEALVLSSTDPNDFSKKILAGTQGFSEGELLNAGESILDSHFSNTPDAIKQVMFRQMQLIYACVDMFAKPGLDDKLSCATSLGTDLLDTVNNAYSAWTLYESSKALNTLTVLDAYLTEYFLAGEDLNFLYTRYGVDNDADLVSEIKSKVLVSSNSFWTIGDYTFDADLFASQRNNFIASVRNKTVAMINNYGLKANYDVLDHAFLIPEITKGKYNVSSSEFSICYKIENNSYFTVNNMSIRVDISDESSALVNKQAGIGSLDKKSTYQESCINVPIDTNVGFNNSYFTATVTLDFTADGLTKSEQTSKVIYLSESNLFDLLKKLALPNIVIVGMSGIVSDNDVFEISADESYVDPSQGTLSFEWKQIEMDDYQITIQDVMQATPVITIPVLPVGQTQKTIWIELSVTASISQQKTTEVFKVIVDSSAQTNTEQPVAFAGEDVQVNIGDTVYFAGGNTNVIYYADKSDADIMWLWTNESNEIVSGNQSFEKIFDMAGVYTYKLVINDDSYYNWSLTTSDSMTVTVVDFVNDVPIATAQTITVDQDTTSNAIVLSAYDANNDALTYTIVTNPVNGILSGTAPNLTYTPTAGYNGNDSFTFKVNDGAVDSGTATVSITINAVQTETITHNGITYGTVTSPITGKIWLDRNLGASQVCTSFDDAACYGDYYQWGRGTDGHEKYVSVITNTLSSSYNPEHSDFIAPLNSSTNNWNSSGGLDNWNNVNNVCPSGFEIPTDSALGTEIQNGSVKNRSTAFSSILKLPSAGYRYKSGVLANQVINGMYWSHSTASDLNKAWNFSFNETSAGSQGYHGKANGMSLRCIKSQ